MTLEELRSEYVGAENDDRIAEYLKVLFDATGNFKARLNDIIGKVGSKTAAQLAAAVTGLTVEKAELLIAVKGACDNVLASITSEIGAGNLQDSFNLNAQI